MSQRPINGQPQQRPAAGDRLEASESKGGDRLIQIQPQASTQQVAMNEHDTQGWKPTGFNG